MESVSEEQKSLKRKEKKEKKSKKAKKLKPNPIEDGTENTINADELIAAEDVEVKKDAQENVEPMQEDENDYFGFAYLGVKRDESQDSQHKKKVVPKWMKEKSTFEQKTIPIEECTFINPMISENLKSMSIQSLFPVQTEVIPTIMKRKLLGGDVCVCAPTGSGKTLVYVIPIVQDLMNRVVVRLRVVVLLPTRDLVAQVKEVFEQVSKGTDLKIEAVYGQSSFKTEQEKLVNMKETHSSDGNSKVDILICTPGRLMDHLQGTPGFTLQHLRYVVIDEADRLLQQSYQDWLHKLLDATRGTQVGGINKQGDGLLNIIPSTNRVNNAIRRYPNEEPLQKLLLSATLTQNPKKLASLRLNHPQFFSPSVEVDFKMPDSLKQFMVECKHGTKPLVILHMLHNLKFQRSLCFTKSVESTHRLYLLLKQFTGAEIVEYSGHLQQKQRNQILEDFNQGKIALVICSDVMSRGLDLQNVQNVINYDVPAYVRGYVHRCGRTARAGKEGNAYTLLIREEVHHFRENLKKVDGGNKVAKFKVTEEEYKPFTEKYQESLKVLKSTLEEEKRMKNAVKK